MKYIHKENGKEYKESYSRCHGHIIYECDGEESIVIRNCFGACAEVDKIFNRVKE